MPVLRILSFISHRHPLLNNKNFELTNVLESSSSNYYSIIIGPNGIGKSYLLKHLVEAFNEISLMKVDKLYKARSRFTLKYQLNKNEYFVSTFDREIKFRINEMDVAISEIILPNKWLASSVTLNDKYPILNYVREKQIPQYKYLGIRSASNNAFISRITINTVLYFLEALRKNKSNQLSAVYKALSLNPEVQIILNAGPMLKLEKKEGIYRLSENKNKLLESHKILIQKNESKISYRIDNYVTHISNPDNIERVFDFMKQHKGKFEKTTKAAMQFRYRINLETKEGIEEVLNDWPFISIMLDLELIKVSKFLLSKDMPFKYEEASSGESHLLTSLHGIIAHAENNSLVVIDEPEVSLHPNWQIDYIDILKKLFESYEGINIVISTHSPFLVSSLKNEESRISSIKRNKESNELELEELDFETFGWDPESILYNVFEVATMRNKYFEMDLQKLISLISIKSEDEKEIIRLRDKVGKYILANEDDPLKLLIKQVDTYLNK